MKIAIAQLNPTVGDVDGNTELLLSTLRAHRGVDLVVFSELFVSGYPPRDLLERQSFVERCERAARRVAEATADPDLPAALFGCPTQAGPSAVKRLHNSALLADGGTLTVAQHKSLLPSYDVFDETRYFEPASGVVTVPFRGEVLGVTICEDAWNVPDVWQGPRYERDPVAELAARGATVFINLSASPYFLGKEHTRAEIVRRHLERHHRPFIFVNQVGGNDELIFDGRSFAMRPEAEIAWHLPPYREASCVVNVHNGAVWLEDALCAALPGAHDRPVLVASLRDALVLGVRDYARKCGFEGAVLGLSGGVDSSVTCCLAVEALGPENVVGLIMPSAYSSPESAALAEELADNLGIRTHTIPIGPVLAAYRDALRETLSFGSAVTVAEENLQARIRGNILMAYSNRYGHLVLSTGNKSELSVGYTTLYGDLAGGLAVISDVYKTSVYELARFINLERPVIPQAILDRAPTAELRPNQTDQDTLPPYGILDRILFLYLEERKSAAEIVESTGYDEATVRWVVNAVRKSEYKRRQAPPGLKVTPHAFGSGRRMPIAAKYED